VAWHGMAWHGMAQHGAAQRGAAQHSTACRVGAFLCRECEGDASNRPADQWRRRLGFDICTRKIL